MQKAISWWLFLMLACARTGEAACWKLRMGSEFPAYDGRCVSASASKIVATLGGWPALAQRVGYANAAGGRDDDYFTPRCGACPGYVCSVGSSGSPRNWPVLVVNARFDKLVKGVTRPGLTVKPMMDKVEDGVGGKCRQLGYFIQKEGPQLAGCCWLPLPNRRGQKSRYV
ncbi:hypothetical protein ACFOLG_12315 [Vogesella facilis]|uniref:Uncharacterized protein n=1 Tax=Vogesella facilis TaxID=1655232 RepID=A0ABV7RJY3_9NEIS